MSKDSKLFSIRIPRQLLNQIEQRASVNRRSRNSEILCLLEHAIDQGVVNDLGILKRSETVGP